MKMLAKDVIQTALEEVGYLEKKTNEFLDDKTANAGDKNWNKYANFIDTQYPNFYNGKKNGYHWCDIFVDYCFIKTFGLDNALFLLCQPLKSGGAGCTVSRSYYKAKGQYQKNPIVGAQIFFTKDGGKSCYHTGIVYAIEDGRVRTVEGNSSNGVRKRSYSISNPTIDGYGVPAYDKEVLNMKTDIEVAHEVIEGKWGTGQERKTKLINAGYNPETVQAIVNAILNGTHVDTSTVGETVTFNVYKNKVSKVIINLI